MDPTIVTPVDCADGDDCTNEDHLHDPDGRVWLARVKVTGRLARIDLTPPAPPPPKSRPRRKPRFTWSKE
jgi:hypothetical protein